MVNRDDTTTNECLPIKLNEVKKKKCNIKTKTKNACDRNYLSGTRTTGFPFAFTMPL